MKDTDILVQAAFDGDLEMVKKLIEDGADINAMGDTWNPLHAAIENMNVDVVKYLLDLGADVEVECNGFRPLHHAIDIEIDAATQKGRGEKPTSAMTRLLIEAGANIKTLNLYGETPLQMSMERDHTDAIRLLSIKE